MWATVERVVLLRWILDVCLVTCITPNCTTAPWEAVRLSDRKFFQPHCWPNICSGLLAEEQLLLVCPTLYKILNNHVEPMHESSNTGSVGETPSVSLAHFMYIHFHQFVHIFLLAHLKKTKKKHLLIGWFFHNPCVEESGFACSSVTFCLLRISSFYTIYSLLVINDLRDTLRSWCKGPWKQNSDALSIPIQHLH